MSHLAIVQQLYPWLRDNGLTDEDTDEAFAEMPKYEFVQKDLQQAAQTGNMPSYWYQNGEKPGLWKSITFRVRAERLQGFIKLFRLVGSTSNYGGQVGRTLLSRAEALANISPLDQLYDAQRDADL